MQKSPKYPINILLIDAVAQNIEVVTQTLNNTKFNYKLHITNNIQQANSFVKNEKGYINEPKPDIIFINTNPILNSERDLTSYISNLNIPIIFLKIANNEIEITKAIDKHINYTSTNKLDLNYFLETIVSLKKFVSSLVKLPEPKTMKTKHLAVISRETTVGRDEKREFGEAKSPETAPTARDISPPPSLEITTKVLKRFNIL